MQEKESKFAIPRFKLALEVDNAKPQRRLLMSYIHQGSWHEFNYSTVIFQ